MLDAVFRHHERFDGQGYPEALGREELEVYPRIVSVADAVDAMTSTRPYRQALELSEAVRRLKEERDRQFDGRLVDHMASLAEAGALDRIIGHSDHETPLVRCASCGPVIAVPRSARDGDTVHCRVCRGKHRLHSRGETFEAEFLDERALALAIEPELEQIHGLLRVAPVRLRPCPPPRVGAAPRAAHDRRSLPGSHAVRSRFWPIPMVWRSCAATSFWVSSACRRTAVPASAAVSCCRRPVIRATTSIARLPPPTPPTPIVPPPGLRPLRGCEAIPGPSQAVEMRAGPGGSPQP